MPIGILNEMQMLNQEVAPPRTLAQQTTHFLKRAWVDLAALRGPTRAAAGAILGAKGAVGGAKGAVGATARMIFIAGRFHCEDTIGVRTAARNPLVTIQRLKISINNITYIFHRLRMMRTSPRCSTSSNISSRWRASSISAAPPRLAG